jgi:ankyrin repeat protein
VAEVSPLLQAVYEGRLDDARRLRDEAGELDGFEAAALGDTERLAAVAEPGAWSVDGFTQLHLAAFFGHADAVLLLLQRGAEVRAVARNDLAVEPLNSAAAGGHVEAARLLLDAGADANAEMSQGFRPLDAAIQNGSSELQELLASYGAISSSES